MNDGRPSGEKSRTLDEPGQPQPGGAKVEAEVTDAMCTAGVHGVPSPSGGASYDPLRTADFRGMGPHDGRDAVHHSGSQQTGAACILAAPAQQRLPPSASSVRAKGASAREALMAAAATLRPAAHLSVEPQAAARSLIDLHLPASKPAEKKGDRNLAQSGPSEIARD